MFSDCVYTEQAGVLLYGAIDSLLRPGGAVIGVLPGMRVGVASFERTMEEHGFEATCIRIRDRHVSRQQCAAHDECGVDASIHIAGGSVSGYRIILWTRQGG